MPASSLMISLISLMISLISWMISLIRQDLFFYYLRGYAFDITAQQTQVFFDWLNLCFCSSEIKIDKLPVSLRLYWREKGLYNFTALLMDIFNAVPLIEYSHNKIFSSILPQPLMLDVLQTLQSSEYSYILNAAHSDTLAVILQNKLFLFNTFFISSSVQLMPKTRSFKSFLIYLPSIFLSNCNGCLIA